MTTCNRAKKRHPELCSEALFDAFCGCGKVFTRCLNHGGTEGAIKSRASHRAVSFYPEKCKAVPTRGPMEEDKEGSE